MMLIITLVVLIGTIISLQEKKGMGIFLILLLFLFILNVLHYT